MNAVRKPLLESTPCTRCFGSGRYAHYGVCFKCGGAGHRLTARGQAAQNRLNAIRRIPAAEFVPGMRILAEGFTAGSYSVPNKWHVVERVEHVKGIDVGYVDRPDMDCVRIVADEMMFVGVPTTTYRRGFTNAEIAAQREDALAYQASLTKSGAPAKRAK